MEISLFQWLCFGGVAALALAGHGGGLWSAVKSALGRLSIFSPATPADDDLAMVAAYKTMAPRLTPELAASLWATIQPGRPPQ